VNDYAKKPTLVPLPAPDDAKDVASLWLDPALGDGLVDVHFHNVPVGKPKTFFRVHPDPAYRRMCEVFTHKVDGQVEEQHYIVDAAMRGRFEEVQRCTLVTVIYRDGSPRLWPLKLPKDGEKDNDAWKTARSAARTAMERWVKLIWVKRAYVTRDARPGYAPEPDWSKLPSFNELVDLAFGDQGIIRSDDHPIVRDELLGGGPQDGGGDNDDLA
jgi:hypothetical protein